MGLFNSFKKAKNNNQRIQGNAKVNINFPTENLEFTLDRALEFLDAFSAELPDEWCHLFISQEFERTSSYTLGKIRIEILLGNWWDSLLYRHPDILNYMRNTFTFDSQKNSFTFSGISTGCFSGAFPQDNVNILLQRFLDSYEARHPRVHFERKTWGAILTRGL